MNWEGKKKRTVRELFTLSTTQKLPNAEEATMKAIMHLGFADIVAMFLPAILGFCCATAHDKPS